MTPLDQAFDLEKLAQDAAATGLRMVTDRADLVVDPALLGPLPVEWVRTNGVLPVVLQGIPVAILSTSDQIGLIDYVTLMIGQSLEPVLVPPGLLYACVEEGYAQRQESPSDLIATLRLKDQAPARRGDDLLLSSRDAPVTQLINTIMLDALRQRASDIHFEPFSTRLRVRFRIDGVLYDQSAPPGHLVGELVSRLKVMAHMDISERRLPQDGMARVRIGDREIDVRVSTVPVAEGERVVLRLLDQGDAVLSLSALGMGDDCLARLAVQLRQPNGMIVVSGPTGSGKTTTLYAALGSLDAERRNIMTIEDPIEYQLENIGQIQVKPKIGISFAMGLRHILRQDPDVILVGETRDAETAEIAVRAALTGHLVFTTLHTNDAPGALVRLADIGVAPYLLSACVRSVLAQRLVRCLCPACRVPYTVTESGVLAARLHGQQAWHPVGCDRCKQGYYGRTGLFELLPMNDALRVAVRDPSFHLERIREEALRAGMLPLEEDGLQKVLAGITTLEEVERAAAV
ncbi:MAG: GspE/PulE family protein [Kiritimatiellia bacterium]